MDNVEHFYKHFSFQNFSNKIMQLFFYAILFLLFVASIVNGMTLDPQTKQNSLTDKEPLNHETIATINSKVPFDNERLHSILEGNQPSTGHDNARIDNSFDDDETYYDNDGEFDMNSLSADAQQAIRMAGT